MKKVLMIAAVVALASTTAFAKDVPLPRKHPTRMPVATSVVDSTTAYTLGLTKSAGDIVRNSLGLAMDLAKTPFEIVKPR